MSIQKLIFFIILLLIAGCQGVKNQTEKQDQSDTIMSEGKKIVKKYSPVLGCDSTIINNEFSFDVLAFEVFKADTAKIKSLFLNPVVLKFEKQKNPEGGHFNLYRFTDGINRLTLYYNGGFYLEDGDIRNDKVLLNNKISIGMAKEDFLKLVKGTNIKCDTVTVVNDETSFETDYIFNNSKLKEIKMGQIVE
jgi:hypothetical protein